MREIGLTGGIGSGKSTVATHFAQQGIPIVDADAISRRLTGPGGFALDAIETAFGPQILDPALGMNRARMRELIFVSPSAKAELEQLLHPLIQQEMDRQSQQHAALGATLCVLEIPLLVESSIWRLRLDHVIVVHCSPQTQLKRVMSRSQISSESAQRILDAQAKPLQRLQAADTVIHNDESVSLAQIEQHVQKWLQIHGIMPV